MNPLLFYFTNAKVIISCDFILGMLLNYLLLQINRKEIYKKSEQNKDYFLSLQKISRSLYSEEIKHI